jgi:hypothetical protein
MDDLGVGAVPRRLVRPRLVPALGFGIATAAALTRALAEALFAEE